MRSASGYHLLVAHILGFAEPTRRTLEQSNAGLNSVLMPAAETQVSGVPRVTFAGRRHHGGCKTAAQQHGVRGSAGNNIGRDGCSADAVNNAATQHIE